MLDLKRVLAAKPKDKPIEKAATLTTIWGEEVLRSSRDMAGVAPRKEYVPRTEHPTPQFMRDTPGSYECLNGWWECACQSFEYDSREDTSELLAQIDVAEAQQLQDWQSILVPFSPETDLSGVGRQLAPSEILWYRRRFTAESDVVDGQRTLLHFQGVDDTCAVWVNGQLIGTHVGGYLPFAFDITDAIRPGENEILLAVTDPSDAGIQLRGKQKINHSDLWYTAQSGIWKTVWLECVPLSYIEDVKQTVQLSDDLQNATVVFEATVCGSGTFCVEINGQTYSQPTGDVSGDSSDAAGEAAVWTNNATRNSMGDAAIGDVETGAGCSASVVVGEQSWIVHLEINIEAPHLWSPEDPYLYDVTYSFETSYDTDNSNEESLNTNDQHEVFQELNGQEVKDQNETTLSAKTPAEKIQSNRSIDTVKSYVAIRSVAVKETCEGTRFLLNGQRYFMKGVLDQGYWPESLMTAPADEALVFDIQQMKQLGFNMLRKHIKIEEERWYYHCDRLGMLVWQDMVTGGGTYAEMQTMYLPTLFTASWGAFSDKKRSFQKKIGADNERYQRLWMETARDAIDLLRNHPCIVTWVLFNEGWGQFDAAAATREARMWDSTRPIESVSGWFDQGTGDYYGVHNYFRDMVVFADKKGCKGSRDAKGAAAHARRACVTCEFGGYVHNVAGHAQHSRSYGYAVYETQPELKAAVERLIDEANALEAQGLSGYVYTQISDVEEETNGLLTYDRRVNKISGERYE